MNIQIIMRLFAVTVYLICLGPFTSVSTQQCGEVLDKPVTLIEDGTTFPQKKFNRKLKRAKRGLQEWLQNTEKLVQANIEEEQESERRSVSSYPSCLSVGSCPSTVKKAQYWQISSEKKCWIIEPITWVTCNTDVPEDECRPQVDDSDAQPVGYSCRERYTTMQVWGYCNDRRSFQIFTIGVPTACMPMYNPC